MKITGVSRACHINRGCESIGVKLTQPGTRLERVKVWSSGRYQIRVTP